MTQSPQLGPNTDKGELSDMFGRFVTFAKEVRVEMGKVSWSTRQELINSTWVVIVSAVLVGALIGVFDFIYSMVVRFLLR